MGENRNKIFPQNSQVDDRGLYAPGQYWLQRKDVVGRAKGFVPYVGMVSHQIHNISFNSTHSGDNHHERLPQAEVHRAGTARPLRAAPSGMSRICGHFQRTKPILLSGHNPLLVIGFLI